MNRDECPEPLKAKDEIWHIATKTQQLIPSAEISRWDKWNWSIALILAIGGLAAVPISGGASLIASIFGVLWLLIDMVKKISETAKFKEAKYEADKLHERLRFLAWCLGGR